jgi:hypothetical protein
MSAQEYAVPAVLRRAMFVPRQAPGRREPARVSAGAFQAAGLPVPAHPGQRNIYQLTQRQGMPWSPGLDAQIRRRGGELLGRGDLISSWCRGSVPLRPRPRGAPRAGHLGSPNRRVPGARVRSRRPSGVDDGRRSRVVQDARSVIKRI